MESRGPLRQAQGRLSARSADTSLDQDDNGWKIPTLTSQKARRLGWGTRREAGLALAFGVLEENAHGGGTAGAEFGCAGGGDYLRSQQGYRAVGERPQREDEGDVILRRSAETIH